MTSRADAKERTRTRLVEAARETVREQGAAALSLRDVARRAGVVPSAVYKHVDSRDALLTTLIVESYAALAEHLESVAERDGAGWSASADGLRDWALSRRHEFYLLYGTPVPGYAAPQETVPLAARIVAVFLAAAPDARIGTEGEERAIEASPLHRQLAPSAADLGVSPARLASVLADLAQLIGLLLLELGGHFVGTADPADHLWRRVVDAQCGDEES
ncbi:MAG: WHG domain-containing protein [Brachybacterium sp.]|nr:WHG domain-containing protein [Brachybacterium sp.]